MSSSSTLPALPENEKTYAGIPEAVFVVSYSKHKQAEMAYLCDWNWIFYMFF